MTNSTGWTQQKRQERMRILLQRLKGKIEPDEIKKIKAKFGFEFGLRAQVVEDYYKQIKEMGLLEESE